MKKILASSFSVVLASLVLSACGGEGGSGLVDPTDPNALSQALVIPGSTRIEGQPPQSSSDPDSPMISGGGDLETTSGDQAVLEVQYDSPSGYTDCYVQVNGADDYFLVSAPSSATTGTIQIPVNIPSDVDTGAFDLYTCIAGENGTVSNPISTVVGVTYPGSPPGGGGNVVCASDDPSVGTMFTCPNGSLLDFCINQNAGDCYYSVGGNQVDCGNCLDDPNVVGPCAERAVNLCF